MPLKSLKRSPGKTIFVSLRWFLLLKIHKEFTFLRLKKFLILDWAFKIRFINFKTQSNYYFTWKYKFHSLNSEIAGVGFFFKALVLGKLDFFISRSFSLTFHPYSSTTQNLLEIWQIFVWGKVRKTEPTSIFYKKKIPFIMKNKSWMENLMKLSKLLKK